MGAGVIHNDAALRRQVEDLTRERDAIRQQVDGVLSIVRGFAENPGTDPVVGKVQKLMACYRGVKNERDEAREQRHALRARLAAMATRDCTNAEMMALAEIIQSEHHQNTSTVGTFWGPSARAAWRYVRDRLHAETAQGANAEPTVASGGAPRMPAPPAPTPPARTDADHDFRGDPLGLDVRCTRCGGAPRKVRDKACASTPPAAEASDVEALARWLHDTYEDCASIMGWRTQESCRVAFDALPLKNRATMRALAAEILRREAALRERAEKAEAEVARLRAAAGRHHVDCDE